MMKRFVQKLSPARVTSTFNLTLQLVLGGLWLMTSQVCAQETSAISPRSTVTWEPALLLESQKGNLTLSGEPKIVDSPMGKALQFDGVDDGLFLDARPLAGLRQFTVEVVFRPNPEGLHEQRFLHIGDVRGSRLMLETRLTKENQWYFDAHVRSDSSAKTLIDSTKLHTTEVWHTVAFTLDNGQMNTFVDGSHELTGAIAFSPINKGQTSIGVRQNKVSWFKGAIWKIRITPRVLSPAEFLKIVR